MKEEYDLGPLYGWQWRNFGGRYSGTGMITWGIDQLEKLVKTLKTNPNDRRMLVVAWNPLDNDKMALPPCHWAFQVTVTAEKLNLFWNQRSVDSMAGLPFNIASYATLLHLLALESGFGEGRLCGFLGDTHIYSNHTDQAIKQIKREPYTLPTIKTNNFTSIFDWEYTDTEVIGYEHHPGIKLPIAV
jgi:thymidylate synthase